MALNPLALEHTIEAAKSRPSRKRRIGDRGRESRRVEGADARPDAQPLRDGVSLTERLELAVEVPHARVQRRLARTTVWTMVAGAPVAVAGGWPLGAFAS